MNATCPRGAYQLLLAPCLALGLTGPILANPDYDFLKVHPSELSIFRREELPSLAYSDPAAQAYVNMYTATGKTHTAAMLGRGLYYFPIFERHLSAEGLPLELKYLSMVESELRTDVESPSGALGLWQFMPATARHYGLRLNDWCDERRDPEAATRAAVQYLKDLFTEFGNWELVVGAYNCGSGRMRQAVRRAKSTDFAAVRKYLPAQTQAYLAKFYAAAYVANFFADHQIFPKIPTALQGGTMRIEVRELNSMEAIARVARVALSKIKRLNPQYTQGFWPRTTLSLVLPEEPARRYLAHFNRIPPRIEVLTEDVFGMHAGYLPLTEPYRILNSLVVDLGNRQPASEQGEASRRYYSKYFLRGEA
jgi:hypothetical protein